MVRARSVPQVFDESLYLFEAVTVGLDRNDDASLGEGDQPHHVGLASSPSNRASG